VEWIEGTGIPISRASKEALKAVKEFSDWANCLMDGLYGEDAKNMRVVKKGKSKPNIKKIHPTIMNHARCKCYLKVIVTREK